MRKTVCEPLVRCGMAAATVALVKEFTPRRDCTSESR